MKALLTYAIIGLFALPSTRLMGDNDYLKKYEAQLGDGVFGVSQGVKKDGQFEFYTYAKTIKLPEEKAQKQYGAWKKISKNGKLNYTAFRYVALLKNPPELSDEKSFSMIVIGDPQCYTRFDYFQPLFLQQLIWCASMRDALNIKVVLGAGDYVEGNNIPFIGYPDGSLGNQTSIQQWQSAADAFARLDNKIPYILCTGNHDYGIRGMESRESKFGEFFPVDKNPLTKKRLVSMFESAQSGTKNLENAAYEFIDENWGKILIVSLECAPRNSAIIWAGTLISSEQFKSHRIILLTHEFTDTSGAIIQSHSYKLDDKNTPAELWNKLVVPSENIKLIINGHAGGFKDWSSLSFHKTPSGRTVPILMSDPQAISGNGGDGWISILEFMPDGSTIKLYSYSTLFSCSPETEHLAWKRGRNYEETFSVEK